MLVKESQGIFFNGPMLLKIAKQIIQKVIETKQAIREVKQNFENFVSKAQQEVPSLKVSTEA